MNEINSILEKMHDIQGLDSIQLWPLAIGWWFVIGAAIFSVVTVIWYLTKWILFRRSWKYDTLQKLNHLQKNISEIEVSNEKLQHTVKLLSEYIRRIALRRFSRSACAGLTGKAWLEWLSKNDSNKFDWMNQGTLLIHAPYARTNKDLTAEQLKILIQATKDWINA